MNKKLYRSRTNRVLWGVCAGLANYFGIDPTIVRIIAVASILAGSLGFWIYIIMAIIVPLEPTATSGPSILRSNTVLPITKDQEPRKITNNKSQIKNKLQ